MLTQQAHEGPLASPGPFAPDRPLFLAGGQAALQWANLQDCYRARSADGRPHWFELALKAAGPARERCLLGRMEERPPVGPLRQPDSPLIIAHFDPEGRHLYVNRGVEGVTGLPATLFLGRTNEELGMPSKLVHLWREKHARVLQREEGEVFEFGFPSAEEPHPEHPTLFLAHLEPVFDERGRILSLRCETYRLESPHRPRRSPRPPRKAAERRAAELDLEMRGRRTTTASFMDSTSRTRVMEAQRFLAESSAALASSLDPEQLLQMLARLCVPGLANVAVLFGLRADATLGVLSLAHTDPELEKQLLRAGQHLPLAEDHPMREILRTGQPRLLSEEEAAEAWRANDDPERWHLRRRLALRSVMLIPITSRQRAPHVLVLGSSERTYTRDDCTFAQEFAAHAASALDNARLYHDAREAVALRDEFLGIAGHELRTPLTALKLGLQNLSRQAAAVGQREHLARWINNCERQGERLNRLVSDLLDVGRLTSGRMPLVSERMDLCALVEEVVARMGPELELAGCRVSMELEHPLLGYWDRSRLDQVLTNLLSNAVKYGKGKPIELRAMALPGDQVRISVRDEGIGIPPADQARIFGRFERAVSERHYGGLGLGLWITRQLVLRFGGHIGVSSEQGKGSTFTVELPREVDTEGADTSRGLSSPRLGRERGTASETLTRLGGEDLYRAILGALWEGIVVQDRDGNIVSANASAEHILGLSVDELTGRTSMDPRWRSIHEDGSDFPGEEHPAMVALRTGKPVRNVLMGIQRPDGTRVWLIVNAQPLQREGESTPYLVVASFFDITASRWAGHEQAREKSNPSSPSGA